MARHDYRCADCGITREVVRGVTAEILPVPCPACGAAMRWVPKRLGFIMRPSGYHLKPGDEGYANFDRAFELGEVREPDPHHTLSRGATVSSKLENEPLKFDEDKRKGFYDAARAVYNELTGKHEW